MAFNGFNRFLDFIGLRDSEQEEAEVRGNRRRNNTEFSSEGDEFEEFEKAQPTKRAASSRQNGSAAKRRVNLAEETDDFGEDQGWSNTMPRSSRSQAYTPRGGRASSAQRPQSTPSAEAYSRTENYGSRRSEASYGSARSESSSSYRNYEASAAPKNRYAGSSESAYKKGSYKSGAPYYGSRSNSSSWTSSYEENSAPAQEMPRSSRQTTIIKTIYSVEECKDIILALIEKKSILLNLSEMDSVQAQRALDTMSGATFAIGATLKRASDRTWLIAPSTVDVEMASDEAQRSY